MQKACKTALANTATRGSVAVTGCAGVGFGAIRAGGFLPVEAAGGCINVAGAYFRGRRACTQYDPKVILGANTLDLKGDACFGSYLDDQLT